MCVHVWKPKLISVLRCFQGSQKQRETGEPGKAEETSGQEGGVHGQPPHPLPQPGEVSHAAITHTTQSHCSLFPMGRCSLTYLIKETLAGTLMAPMNNNKIPLPMKTICDSEVRLMDKSFSLLEMVSHICLTHLISVSTAELRS